MQIPLWSVDCRPRPPPLWLVSNGHRTVGPVRTSALGRSAALGELPDEGWARIARTRGWRELDEVREVRAARHEAEGRGPRADLEAESLSALLRLADDQDEALVLALRLAARKVGAHRGFLHAFRRGDHAPSTRHVLHASATDQIGVRLPAGDMLAHVARIQNLALGDVDTHRAFRDAADRLGGDEVEVRGVAMVPLLGPHGPIAMIELGREDRPFRAADAAELREVARIAAPGLRARAAA